VIDSFIHSFIPDICIAPLKETYSELGALSPATAKEKCPKKLVEWRHVVSGQKAQCKREFIPSGGANNRESADRARGTKSSPRAEERIRFSPVDAAFHSRGVVSNDSSPDAMDALHDLTTNWTKFVSCNNL